MLFSVIVPCYNSEKSIIRALQSVLNQTLNDLEIIVVDDGSSDNSKVIVNNFLKNIDVAYKLINQDNHGAASARNIAVKNSIGTYIAFLDADDEWHKDKLQIQYKYIKKFKARFISCEYTLNNLNTCIDSVDIKEYSFKNFLLSNRTSTPCTIIERDLFNEVDGFEEGQRYSEDYYLWLKISYITKLYKLDVPLVKLYKNAYGEGGLSARLWQMEKSELKNYVKLYNKNYINIFTTMKYGFISYVKFLKRYLSL